MVRVAVATLWSTPDAVRPVDSRALGRTADIPSWVASMSAEQQVGDGVLSQLLLGERVRVDEVRADGWVRVVALQQPGVRDQRGYPGWIPAEQLVPAGDDPAVDDTTLVVDATSTDLRVTPGGPVALANVMLGTRLVPVGAAVDGWVPVRAGSDTLWVSAADVVPGAGAGGRPMAALGVATRLCGVPYVWGGLSAYGIDCSGLVHLSWRRFGVTLPRDAADQAAATRSVPLGSERPGDLYFFARPGRRIHHVGIVTAGQDGGPRRMLHACYTQRRVVEEPLSAAREETLVAAHRVAD
ncbi:peptidase P60 [Asanoa siamensis]|uniref:Peptidase P60 n=2 Tax=Asanoa siamensis TaxID=926357 RepID=A0ABQ4CMY3_9ACTN|nr:peptidase P60 [Asanoa siamensis]